MKKQNEISSTEKLLDLIRAASDSRPAADDPQLAAGSASISETSGRETPVSRVESPRLKEKDGLAVFGSVKQRLQRKFQFPDMSIAVNKCTVGVDIGYHEIRLVKVVRTDGNSWKLIDYQVVPMDPDISPVNPRFSSYLGSVLHDFCGAAAKMDIWSSITSAGLEVRHLRIPKVPLKQLAPTVLWSFKKNNINFVEEKFLFDFEVQGEIVEGGIEKMAVLAYSVPMEQVKKAKELFVAAGFPLTGLTCIPFSLQNLFREGCLRKGGDVVCNLYIGREWSRIDIYSHGNLVLIRGVNGGTNSMIKGIVDGLSKRVQAKMPAVSGEQAAPAALTMENLAESQATGLAAGGGTTKPVSFDQARKVLFSLHPASPPLNPEDPGYDLKESEVFQMIRPAVDRLTRQLERTFRYYASIFDGESVAAISICGNVETYGHLVDYISEQLGVAKSIFSPLASSESCFKTDILDHELVAESHSNAQALGLAISNNAYTPNFLFTHRDKARMAWVKRLNRAVIILFLFLMTLCTGVALWQKGLVAEKEKGTEAISQEMTQYNLVPDQNYLFKMVDRVKLGQQRFKVYGKRYLGLAIISELALLTPDNVALLNMDINLGPAEGGGAESGNRMVVLKGIVSGEAQRLESLLAEYIVVLGNSPLFNQPEVQQSGDESYKGSKVLYFTLNLEIK